MATTPLSSLHRQARWVIVFYVGGLGLWAWILNLWSVDSWFPRVLLATLAAVLIWVFTWPRLSLNHPLENADQTWPELGAANLLTLGRAGLLAMLASLILPLAPGILLSWGPIALWAAAVALDGLDGRVARRLGRATSLGTSLDIEVDSLGALIAAGVAVSNYGLPLWFLPLNLLRPIFAMGIWWHQRQGKPISDWPVSATRRYIAGLQMVGLGMALWPGVPSELVLVVAMCLTVLLICSFGRDWGVVTDMPAALAGQAKLQLARVRNLRQVWLPTSLRPLAGLSVLTALADRVDLQSPPETLLVSAMLLGLTILLLGGWWARTSGMLLIICAGLLSTLLPYVPSMAFAVIVGMGFFLLGKGTSAVRHLRTETGGRR